MRTLTLVASSREPRPLVDIEPLMESSRIIDVFVKSLSVDTDLTVTQLRVLVFVAGHDGPSLSEVAEELGINASNATRTCQQLVQAGLVKRDVDSVDRRRVTLTLAAPGKRMVRRVIDRRRELLKAVVGGLSPRDQRALMAAAELFNAAAMELNVKSGTGVRTSPELAVRLD